MPEPVADARRRVAGVGRVGARGGPGGGFGGRAAAQRRRHRRRPCTAAGALLGRFHGLLADLDPATIDRDAPRIPPSRPAPRRAAGGRRRRSLRAGGNGAGRDRDGLKRPSRSSALAADLTAGSRGGWPTSTPSSTTSSSPATTRSASSTSTRVMPGAWFWDVGDLLRSGATTAAEDEPDPDRPSWSPRAVPGDRRRLPRRPLDGRRQPIRPKSRPSRSPAPSSPTSRRCGSSPTGSPATSTTASADRPRTSTGPGPSSGCWRRCPDADIG